MLTDRSRPMIDRVSEFLIPTSKSKLDNTQIVGRSTRAMIRYDMGGGVGLGILAALERSSAHVTGSGNPVPVHNYGRRGFEEMMSTGFEDRSNGGMMKKKKNSIFSLSPGGVEDDSDHFPSPGFLSCCNLCRKKLSGKDIYMYRGEKGFCSAECREVQIAKDEKKEELRSHGVSRSAADVVAAATATSSPYVRDQRMLSTGIFAI